MSGYNELQEGMQVYGADERMLGRIERVHGSGFDVAGQHYQRDSVVRVEHNRVYVQGSGMAEGLTEARASDTMLGEGGEIRVPVVEERLDVGKREVDLGEVAIRRRVIEEEQSVPVTLRREEVHIEQVGTPVRPLRPGEEAFQEGTIRVAVRGEEAVVAKEAIVTGELVVEKDVTEEQRTISDTLRRTEVEFDENYRQARAGFEQDFTTRQASATTDWARSRTWEQAEPNYQAGFRAGGDERYRGRSFEEAESDLRGQYESGALTGASRRSATSGETWEHLREEIRAGFDRARNR